MRDRDVRIALRRHLDVEHAGDTSTRIIEELGLCEEARVDFAVVNGSLTGFELKSERDTLARLPRQAATYSRVFDYVHLVAAAKHVEHACEVIPSWWGIIVASPDPECGLSLSVQRRANENPTVDPAAVVQLLWRNEALEILERLGADQGIRSKPRETVWRRLTETVSLATLRCEVRGVLKARRGWRESQGRRENALTLQLSDRTPRFLARRMIR